MTSHSSQFPRFYVTAPSKCPYLDGKEERKVFTELSDINPGGLHESLARVGFRRSQDIAYRPNCENCTECKSLRIPVFHFRPGKTQKRIIRANSDILSEEIPNIATQEQYDLLQKYLKNRHSDGGMANMGYEEYVSMVEFSPIKSCLIEYRLPVSDTDTAPGKLIAVTLTDIMEDGLSMVYSFYDINDEYKKRSLGTYMILDHIARTRLLGMNKLYLGYWVQNSPKMAYKQNFRPVEILDEDGWKLMENR